MTAVRKHASLLTWALITPFLLWLIFTIAAYYWAQNAYLQQAFTFLPQRWLPLTFSATALLQPLLDLLAAAWLTLTALGLGLWALERYQLPNASPLAHAILGLGLGFGALGLTFLIAGLLGLFRPPFAPPLLVLLALTTLLTTPRTLTTLRQLPRPRPPRPLTLFLLLAGLLTLTLALLPPTDWDGLFYHLKGPKLYLEAGRIYPGIDIPHLNFPALFEMLFAAALLVRGDVAAKLLHLTFIPLLAGLVYLLARDTLKLKTGWTAVLFLTSLPMIWNLAPWAYNDLPLAFYELAALYAFLKSLSENAQIPNPKSQLTIVNSPPSPNPPIPASSTSSSFLLHPSSFHPSWLILSGLFCGLAMSLKYTSFVAPLTLALLLIYPLLKHHASRITHHASRITHHASRITLRPLLLLAIPALLIAAPWYLKNLAFTGNPIYPFVFGGTHWDDFRAAAYAESGTGIAYNPDDCTPLPDDYIVGQSISGCRFDPLYLTQRLLLLPLDLTLELNDANRHGPTGPLFLLFLPLLIAYALPPRLTHQDHPSRITHHTSRITHHPPLSPLHTLLFFALTHYLFWTLGVISSSALFQSRLLLPAFVALCPAVAYIYHDLSRFNRPQFSLQRFLGILIALSLVVSLIIQLINWLPYQPWAYLFGRETRTQYLQRTLGDHYHAMQTINQQLPADSVILFLWEPRSYYCDLDCRPDSILDQYGRLQHQYHTAPAIATTLQAEGITHILLWRQGLNLILEANSPTDTPLPEPAVLRTLQTDHLELVTTIGSYELFRLQPSE